LKILDFGIARAIDNSAKQLTTTSTSTGTALYMAPEQKTAADTVGPPADLYAVTAIFYELLLGVAPTGRWMPLSREREDLPAGVDAVIDRGLSSRPRSRYQNAQEYLRALHEIRSSPMPLDTPVSDAARTSPIVAAIPSTSQPAGAHRLPLACNSPTPVPQTITVKGRVRTELLIWSNAAPERLHQSVWRVFGAFGLSKMQSDQQTRTACGVTGLNWQTLGQKISASVEKAPDGSTVNIIDQTMGPAFIDMGRGRNEVRTISGMLIQNLEAEGWKAHVLREVHCSLPTWLLALIVLGFCLLGTIIALVMIAIDYA